MRIPFLPQPGIVSDDTTFSTPGRYADGSNVRFWRGKPQVIGGWSKLFSTALTGTCRNILGWQDNSGYQNIAFGTNSALMVYVGGTLYDITTAGLAAGSVDGAGGPGYGAGTFDREGYGQPALTEYYARTWSLGNWGQALVANPRGGTLYIWQNNTAADATAVTQAPDIITSILVTPERQVLAFGCNEEVSTTFNPLCIRGSDIEDYTDWTTTASNNAFEHILEGSGRIVSARMLGSYVAVWTDSGCYIGQFIGDPGQTYRFDLVAQNCGLIGPNAVTVYNQTAYWITPDFQIYSWSPGTPPTPMQCPIQTEFRDNALVGQSEKIVASSVGRFGEIWFFYPDGRDGIENSRYIALSTFEGTWFRGELARTAFADAGAIADPLGTDASGYVYMHESGQTADGGALTWHLETSDQYLGDAARWFMLKGIWPDFEDQVGPVSMEIYLRPYPQADTTTKGPYTLATSAGKKDFLASGRVAAVKFYGSSTPAFVRFGAPSFEAIATGSQ